MVIKIIVLSVLGCISSIVASGSPGLVPTVLNSAAQAASSSSSARPLAAASSASSLTISSPSLVNSTASSTSLIGAPSSVSSPRIGVSRLDVDSAYRSEQLSLLLGALKASLTGKSPQESKSIQESQSIIVSFINTNETFKIILRADVSRTLQRMKMALPDLVEAIGTTDFKLNYAIGILTAIHKDKAFDYNNSRGDISLLSGHISNPIMAAIIKALDIEDAFSRTAPHRAYASGESASSQNNNGSFSSDQARALAQSNSSAFALSMPVSSASSAPQAPFNPIMAFLQWENYDAPKGIKRLFSNAKDDDELMQAFVGLLNGLSNDNPTYGPTDSALIQQTFKSPRLTGVIIEFIKRYISLDMSRTEGDVLSKLNGALVQLGIKVNMHVTNDDLKNQISMVIVGIQSIPMILNAVQEYISTAGWVLRSNQQYNDLLTSLLNDFGVTHALAAALHVKSDGTLEVLAQPARNLTAQAASSGSSASSAQQNPLRAMLGQMLAAGGNQAGNNGNAGNNNQSAPSADFNITDGQLNKFGIDNYMTAAYLGDKTIIEFFISRYPQYLDVPNKNGQTALMLAAFGYAAGNQNAAAVFKYLLAQGASTKVEILENAVKVRNFEQHIVNQASRHDKKARYQEIRQWIQEHQDNLERTQNIKIAQKISALQPEALPASAGRNADSSSSWLNKKTMGWGAMTLAALGFGYLYYTKQAQANNSAAPAAKPSSK